MAPGPERGGADEHWDASSSTYAASESPPDREGREEQRPIGEFGRELAAAIHQYSESQVGGSRSDGDDDDACGCVIDHTGRFEARSQAASNAMYSEY